MKLPKKVVHYGKSTLYRKDIFIEPIGIFQRGLEISRISEREGQYEDLSSIVKRRKPKWNGHETRTRGLSNIILLVKVQGKRRRGGQTKN